MVALVASWFGHLLAGTMAYFVWDKVNGPIRPAVGWTLFIAYSALGVAMLVDHWLTDAP